MANTGRGDEEAKRIKPSDWQSEVGAPHPGCSCLRGQLHGAGTAFRASISPKPAGEKHTFVVFGKSSSKNRLLASESTMCRLGRESPKRCSIIYVNETNEDIRFLGGSGYVFSDGDEVLLVPSIAGGAE